MTTYLIDTHILLWLINHERELGDETLTALSLPYNRVLLSYFSLYELTLKAASGKLYFDLSIADDLPKMGIELIYPDLGTLQHYKIYNPANKDPVDNILLAVAKAVGCVFVTSDAMILSTKAPVKLLDARL